MTALIIYSLCALLSLAIATSLWRHHARTRSRLLYWSALCFSGLALNNILLVLDKVVYTELDLAPVRQVTALLALCVMLFGLTWEEE
jgi:hypothetical protein